MDGHRKPPRDEDAEHILRLCREGRLFELQARVADGKSLTVPAQYRKKPLLVALETGFHSLIEFLLQHENDQATKDEFLRESCWRGQYPLMQLALQFGASVTSVSFQDVIETWNRDVVRMFLSRGADPVADAPFARAFKRRIKAVLGIYLDCKGARPDVIDALQGQLDMALRQACQDDDLKWVSLLMWLGGNARTKGLMTDDLDTADAVGNPEYQQSALQIACQSRKPEILKRLKPDPAIDDLSELIAAAGSLITTPETVAYLVDLGGRVNDQAGGGSTALDTCLRHLGWKEMVLDAPYPYAHVSVPIARLGKSVEALEFLLRRGAQWKPNDRSILEVRRALYRLESDALVAVIELLRTYRACDEAVLKALLGTPKMRKSLVEFDKRRASSQGHRGQVKNRGRTNELTRAKTSGASHFSSRYDRRRLYEEVWSEPTQKVAQRYGVSGVAIGKACTVLDIPKPPRGYWAKKAAGHQLPSRPHLPDSEG